MKYLLSVLVMGCLAVPASATLIVDGTLDASYGPAVAMQSVQTQFGDEDGSNNGGNGVGSEMDAAYAKIWGGRLYLLLTGNIQPNFNKLEIFIDSAAGGENTLTGTPDYDFGNSSQNMLGLTFDNGFNADYHIFARGGDAGSGLQFDVDFINRAGGGSAAVAGNGLSTGLSGIQGTAGGTITPADLPAFGNISGAALTQNLVFAFDNSNTAGVASGTGAANTANALAVTTGLELSVALADIGNPAIGDTILISVMQNNDNHNFLSNQVLGGLPAGTGNLGGDGGGGFTGDLSGVNFNQFTGLQHFPVTITAEIPEPSTFAIAMFGLVGMVVAAARSRRGR